MASNIKDTMSDNAYAGSGEATPHRQSRNRR